MIEFIHIAKNAGTTIGKMISTGLLSGFNYHNHFANVERIEGDQMIILRDPYQRFTSSFYYFDGHGAAPKRRITPLGIQSPSELAELLYDKDPIAEKLIKAEDHRIGTRARGYNWVFMPQHYWIGDPKHVLWFDTLQDDFYRLLDTVGHPRVELLHKNPSRSDDGKYSDKARKFIQEFYKYDFEAIDHYKRFK